MKLVYSVEGGIDMPYFRRKAGGTRLMVQLISWRGGLDRSVDFNAQIHINLTRVHIGYAKGLTSLL